VVEGQVRAVLVAAGGADLLKDAAALQRLADYEQGLAASLASLLQLRDIPLVFGLELFRPLARWFRAARRGRLVAGVVVAAALGAASWAVEVEQEVGGRCTVVARERAPVRAPRAGAIRSVRARDGALVEAGEVLAILEPDDGTGEVPIVAPARGVLADFDLDERSGASLARGERVGTIGTSERPRLEVEVSVRDRCLLATGGAATVRLAGRAALEGRLVDLGSPRRGSHHLRAVLELDGPEPSLGETGQARIKCGRVRVATLLRRTFLPWLERP
jgi:hypothetical protein